jgi:hypothetical protein
MINEFEFFHGAALVTISQASKKPIIIESLHGVYENSAYILNNSMGLYIKHSKKRLSPWIFTFHKKHQDTIRELNDIYGNATLLLICGSDGIVGLTFKELKDILDHNHAEIEWIRVDRTKGKLYRVTGTDGALDFKIGMTDYINKALNI